MKREGSLDSRCKKLSDAQLPYTSLERVKNRAKRRQQSLDLRDTQKALLEEHKYNKQNVYLSATPFHSAAEKMLKTTQLKTKSDVESSIAKDLRQSAKEEAEEDDLHRLLGLRGKVPPKELVDPDRELVENLDGWSIKKGTYLTIMPTRTDPRPEPDSTFKTQQRPLGFTKRNTISLDMLKHMQSSKARPSLRLAHGSHQTVLLLPQILQPTIPEEGVDDDNISSIPKSPDAGRKQSNGSEDDWKKELDNDADISPRRTSIGDLLMTNATSKNVEYESGVYNKFTRFTKKLEKKKKKELALIVEKGKILQEIAQLREQVCNLQVANNRNVASRQTSLDSESPGRHSKGSTSKLAEVGEHIMREKRVAMMRSCDGQIIKFRQRVDEVTKKAEKARQAINYLKLTVAQLRQELCDHYHKLLSVGTDTRQEGLVWIVKAIWGLEANVNISKLPAYLEEKSVEYLFTVARKQMELEQLRQELTAAVKRYKGFDTARDDVRTAKGKSRKRRRRTGRRRKAAAREWRQRNWRRKSAPSRSTQESSEMRSARGYRGSLG